VDHMRGLGYYLRGKFFLYIYLFGLFINSIIYLINNDSLNKLNELGFYFNLGI
jgi:hypothetical protein